MAVQVLFAREVLHLGARGFGLLLTATAAGSVLGSVLVAWISARLGAGRALLVAIGCIGAGLAATGLAPSGPVAWLAGVAIGLFIAVWGVLTVSLRQSIVPDHLLGRVNSAYRFFGWGTLSVGALLGGVMVSLGEPALGREWALRAPFLVAAAGHGILLAYALRWAPAVGR